MEKWNKSRRNLTRRKSFNIKKEKKKSKNEWITKEKRVNGDRGQINFGEWVREKNVDCYKKEILGKKGKHEK